MVAHFFRRSKCQILHKSNQIGKQEFTSAMVSWLIHKPSLKNFHVAFERLGHGPDGILHVAQSLYHDIAPASMLGLRNVWINRRKEKPGHGATSPATATPNLEVANLTALSTLMCPNN